MTTALDGQALIDRLPPVRGRLEANRGLAEFTWFRAGGPAEALFQPADEDDLAAFLKAVPEDIPITIVGIGSNLLVREGGIPGFVIRLSAKGFGEAELISPTRIRTGAATPALANVAAVANAPTVAVARISSSTGWPADKREPSRTMSRMSPISSRSPANVPARLAASSASPAISPRAKCLTERDAVAAPELAAATCSANAGSTSIWRSCASSRKPTTPGCAGAA